MKKYLCISFFTLLLLSFFHTKAQQGVHILPDKQTSEIVKKALIHTYNYEFEQSKAYCDQIRKKYPQHPGPDFIMALNLYWEMFYNDSYKERTPVFLNYLNKSQELSKKMLEKNSKDIEGVFFKLASECYTTLFYSERGELSSTMGYARKMYGSMKTAFELKTKLNEFYFPSGIYNYYVVMYPEAHPIFKPFMWMFMSGSKATGFKELNYAWENAVFSKTECGYHLCNIYLKYEGTPLKAYEYTKTLYEKYPDNLFFAARHIEVLIAREEYKEAEKIANILFKSGKKYFIATACTFYGILYEKHFKDLNNSIKFYSKAVQLFKETANPEVDFLSFAYAGLGRVYKLQGNKIKAKENYELCKDIAEYLPIKKEVDKFFSGK